MSASRCPFAARWQALGLFREASVAFGSRKQAEAVADLVHARCLEPQHGKWFTVGVGEDNRVSVMRVV